MTQGMLPPKKDVAVALLKGPSVYVHLDPRADDVIVPNWFKKQPQLVLQIGLSMAVPIPDLEVGESGISCTLSFNRSPFWCSMPWTAIYALVGEDGRGMIWPDDVPGELAAKTQKPKLVVVDNKKGKKKVTKIGPDVTAKAGKTAPTEGARPKLTAVAPPVEAEGSEADDASDGDDDKGKAKLPPYLRVIK